ncbi:MAG: bicyclomycin resistance protein [Rubrivivax sp.]|nr:bicyclomycin resistance protein [Rubrivivax sp.]
MRRLLLPIVLTLSLPFNAAAAAGSPSAATAAPKTLRLAQGGVENGFDPVQISDVVSAALVSGIFDAPLRYDYLARPAKVVPNTAAALPEISDNYKRYVFRIRPGIRFADHPLFKGQPRELTAADYVYSIKRYYDPATRSPTLFHYQNAGVLGLNELRQKAIDTKTPFDYDTEVEGLRTLDRYTFEVRLSKPAPRLSYVFASGAISGALAREVVEHYKDKIAENPVGTGAFKLVFWKRASRIVYERNPDHHGVYDEKPNADDKAGQAIAARLKGRKLPLVDRIEFSYIDEAQPRWLAFLNGEVDLLGVPAEYTTQAVPGGKLAPNLAKRGIQLHAARQPSTWYTYFGMQHPVTGGYTPDKVALRRALALAYDAQREIDTVRKGQMEPAQTLLPPQVSGYDGRVKTEMSDHSPARARALLDLYGYVDKDGDGWRDLPDGKPLVLEYTSQTDQIARGLQELWRKAMSDIGVRIEFRMGSWQENIKASRAGKLMMWNTGWSAALPDGSYFLDVLYGPNKGQSNHSRFDLAAFNKLHEQQRELPDGPERDALIAQAMRLSVAYMPMKATGHTRAYALSHPHVVGYVPHPFTRDFWRWVDVESPQ